MAVPKKKDTKVVPPQEDTGLNLKQELFCQYYTQNSELRGNATLSYAEAYDYRLDTLSREPIYDFPDDEENRQIIEESEHTKAYNVCGVEAHRLLKNPRIQKRKIELLCEMLKNDVVDSELAKVILQDADVAPKVAAIREYNKLGGRIIDKTKIITERFTMDDIRTLLAPLPQQRQDEIYGILTIALADAELLRSGAEAQGSNPQ